MGFVLLLLAAATPGPDFVSYMDWARAANTTSFDRVHTRTISPLNVPVNTWAHGTGFVFSSGRAVARFVGGFAVARVLGGPRSSALVVGGVVSLVFWAAMLSIIWIASSRDPVLTVFGAGIAFIGTHAGYYSHVHASESVAMAAVAVLVWLALKDENSNLADALTAGLMAAFLITIKSYLAMYAVPPLVLIARREWLRRKSPRRVVFMALLVAVPGIVATLQVGFVNRWMTGSYLRSPYVFGDEGFRSFDLADPAVLATMLSPWHGWFTYHPLSVIALLCVVVLALGAPSLERRVLWGAFGLLIAGHFYFQASWVVWWLGQATFGSRGMAPACAVLVAALVTTLQMARKRNSTAFAVLSTACGVASLWSFLLLMQGVTSFYSYRALLSAQVAHLTGLAAPASAVFLLAGVGLVFVLYRGVWRGGGGLAVRVLGCLLAGLSLTYLMSFVASRPAARIITLLPGLVVLASLGLTWWGARALLRRFWGGGVDRTMAAWAPPLAAGLLFAVVSLLFLRLAVETERSIAAGSQPSRSYAFVNTFNVTEMQLSCREYRHADDSFAGKRSALREFLIRQGYDPADVC